MPHFDRTRDEALAAEVNVDRALMCPAAGCPNRWSVDGDRGRACSAHYWANPREWPRITERLVRAETDRALYAARQRPERPEVTLEQRRAAVVALDVFVAQRNAEHHGWARELQRRHQAGERLTPAQIQAYRTALRLDIPGAVS